MEERIALVGIIVENPDAVEQLNAILHEYSGYIIGRMGLPCRDQGLSLISIAMCAPNNVISAMSGKLGMLPGVAAKSVASSSEKKRRAMRFQKLPALRPSPLYAADFSPAAFRLPALFRFAGDLPGEGDGGPPIVRRPLPAIPFQKQHGERGGNSAGRVSFAPHRGIL